LPTARRARCAATREEEHAVSVATHGPESARQYDTLPHMNAAPDPVPAWAPASTP